MPYYPIARVMPYARSKAMVETECWRAAAAGQDVVVAISCAVIGGNYFFPDIARGDTQTVVHGQSAKIAYPSKGCQRPVPGSPAGRRAPAPRAVASSAR